MKKVYSSCIDVMGKDAGTIFICAASLAEAKLLINNNLGDEVTYIGNLRENPIPAKYWPSETFTILGESEGLMVAVDEEAEEAKQAAAEAEWQEEQMKKLHENEVA